MISTFPHGENKIAIRWPRTLHNPAWWVIWSVIRCVKGLLTLNMSARLMSGSGPKRTSESSSLMSAFGGKADIEISGRAVAVRPFFSAFPATVKLADLNAGRVLCAIRVTCAGPGSPADRSAAQSFQSEHVPLEAWPQGGARSRPRRQCSRDLQSFSGAPRSSRAWSCR